MNEVIAQLVANAPAAAVGIIIVLMFLRFLEGERVAREKLMDACHTAHKAVIDSTTKALHDCSEAIRECARMHGEVAGVMRELKEKAS